MEVRPPWQYNICVMKHTGATDIEILRIAADQAAELRALLRWRQSDAAGPPTPDEAHQEHELAAMRAHLQDEHLLVWAARTEGRLAGYLAAAWILKPDPREYLYIDELWTAPPYRRRGLARRLLAAAVAQAHQMDLWAVRLSAADTAAARAFYRQAGFRVEPGGWSELRLTGSGRVQGG